MIRAIIVDDEPGAIKTLKSLLAQGCPEVQVIGESKDIDSAERKINQLEPDLLFLDINMPNGSGLELVRRLGTISTKVIFTTAYQEYAIESIRLCALDYLLKPIIGEELQEAIRRFKEMKQSSASYQLLNEIFQFKKINRIAVIGTEDIRIVDKEDILYIASERNYSVFYLKNESPLTATKSIGEYESLLENHGFCRVNKSHLIHMIYVKRYIKGRGGKLVLINDDEIEVSRLRKEIVIRFLGDLS